MSSNIHIKEIKQFNLEGGYLVDGFPSVGFASAIATESMIHTSNFKLAGIIDSENFPPVSLVKDSKPNYPTRVFVNEELKTAVFSSYLTPHESLHREIAKAMIEWAKKHKVSLIISSVAVKTSKGTDQIVAAGNTDSARKKLSNAGLKILEHGTIPGIPGMLLNEGSMNGQDVIVVLFQSIGQGPDFKSSADLCMAMSKLVPGATCNIAALQKEAEKAEQSIKETEEETRNLKSSMYR